MPTPHDEIARAIARWEGLYSTHPNDSGNYLDGRLVGTMRGVTPAVLAAHRGIPHAEVTPEVMKAVTLTEAAEIGAVRYYKGTGLDLLAWGPATAALVDMGWMSGPTQAVKSLQRMIGVPADGAVGPVTTTAYAEWVRKAGWGPATDEVAAMRAAFYRRLAANNGALAPFLTGWLNRAAWFSTRSPEWWPTWEADMPPLPMGSVMGGEPQPAPVQPAPAPVGKSRTAGGAVVAGGGVVGGAVVDAITEASGQVVKAGSMAGTVKWVLIGLAVAGVAYALWRLYQDRKPEAI